MTPTDLEAFRRAMGWNRKTLGTELGISQDRLRRFMRGQQPIPLYMELACAALQFKYASPGARMKIMQAVWADNTGHFS